MSEGENSFCVRCGVRLPDGAVYCPECGYAVDGTGNPHASPNTVSPSDDRLRTMGMATMLYGVLSIVGGLLFVAVGMMLTPEMWDMVLADMTPEEVEMIESFGYDFLKDMFYIMGAPMLASGVLATASFVLMNRRTNWTVCMVLCALATALTIIYGIYAVVTVAIGAYVTYTIYRSKDVFES